MDYNGKKIAGLLLFIGAVQFVLSVIVTEALDSGYSFGQPIIFLGTGSAAAIFNTSLFLLGALSVTSAYFIYRAFRSKLFFILMAVTGIGLVAVSIFTENSGSIHVFFVRTFMIFAIPTVLFSFKFQKAPFSYVSIGLGLIILSTVFLFLSDAYINPSFYLGISRGAMQRLIIYPILLWMLGFGAYLTGDFGIEKPL